MSNIKATRSRILFGFSFAILLASLSFYGCGSNSSSTLDIATTQNQGNQGSTTPVASLPGSYTVATADLPISPPAIPTVVQVSAAAAASITITSLGGGQVQVTLPPGSLPTSQFPPVGALVTIGSAPAASGTYDGTFTVVASDPSTQSLTITAPYVGPLAAGATPTVQQQLVAAPITAAAPSTTTPGQTTIGANNTLTNGTPITIVGSSNPSLNGPNIATNTTPQSFNITATITPSTAPSTPLPAGSNLGVVLAGGGVVPAASCATTTTGTAGAITLPKSALDMDTVPSRFTGVAPLAVFFAATGTTATATTHPFHDLEYRWNFGDDDTLTWANGAHVGDGSVLAKKNRATGPVAAHVFETKGTYIVNLTVTDGTNTVSNGCVQIAVQDPDLVYAGTNTVCIANSTATAGSGGCPVGAATPAGTAAFDTALSNCLTGPAPHRCLFKRGDTFTSSANGSITIAGPITIGAYPIAGTTPPLIQATKPIKVIYPSSVAVNDLRIMDLEITDSASTTELSYCMDIGANASYITALRLDCHDIHFGVSAETGAAVVGYVMQDSTVYNLNGVGGNAWIGQVVDSAFLGNRVGPYLQNGEHGFRIQPGQRVAITNNTMTGISAGKQDITIRAAENSFNGNAPPNSCWGGPGGTTCIQSSPPSNQALYGVADTHGIYISDNKIDGAGINSQLVQVAPAGIFQDQWIYDVVLERNWLIFGSAGQYGIYITASRVTVRNNLCDATGGSPSRYCFVVTNADRTGHVPNPDANEFYNNTCYAGDNAPFSQLACVFLSANVSPSGYNNQSTDLEVTNTVLKNNLSYSQNAAQSSLLYINNQAYGSPWASGTAYVVGNEVAYGGVQYIAIQAGTSQQPDTATTYWRPVINGTVGASGTSGNSSNAQTKSSNPNFLNASGLFNTPSDFKLPTSGSYATGGGLSDGTVPVWSDFFLLAEPSPRDMGAMNH